MGLIPDPALLGGNRTADDWGAHWAFLLCPCSASCQDYKKGVLLCTRIEIQDQDVTLNSGLFIALAIGVALALGMFLQSPGVTPSQ